LNQDDTIIDYRGVRLAEVIERAYGLDIDVTSGPTSIWIQRYDIQAGIRPEALANQVPAMLRRLLEERFNLKVHAVAAEHEEYWLVVADSGLKIRPVRPLQGKGKKDCGLAIIPKAGVGVRIVAKGYTMRMVAVSLSHRLQTPVVDKTATEGTFEFEVEYLPPGRPMQWGGLGPFVGIFYPEAASPPRMAPYPSIPVALEEQLGLKLERHVTSTEFLVVDHVNTTPNRR
jgi:uncharacterized protein (TIGR03435 family)